MLTSTTHQEWTNPDVDCWLDKDIIVHLRSFIAFEWKFTKRVGKIIFLDALCDYYLVIGDLEKFRSELIKRTSRIFSRLLFWIIFSKSILIFRFLYYWEEKFMACIVSLLIVEIYFCLQYVNFSLKGPQLRRINNPETNKAFADIDYSEATIERIANKRYKEKIS